MEIAYWQFDFFVATVLIIIEEEDKSFFGSLKKQEQTTFPQNNYIEYWEHCDVSL